MTVCYQSIQVHTEIDELMNIKSNGPIFPIRQTFELGKCISKFVREIINSVDNFTNLCNRSLSIVQKKVCHSIHSM